MKALLAGMLFSIASIAQAVEAGPAPVPPEGHPHVTVMKGQVMPFDGLCGDKLMTHYDLDRLVWYQRRQDTMEAQRKNLWWEIGVAILGGAALGVGGALLLKK